MRHALALLVILGALTLTACGGAGDDGRQSEAASAGSTTVEPSTTPLPEVLTGEDMDSFEADRSQAIDRDSPLGEEHDAVGELQKRLEGGS